jgi:molybdate transport system ATP-binding protein
MRLPVRNPMLVRRWRSTGVSVAAPLATFRRAGLGWPGQRSEAAMGHLDLTVHSAGSGGHALLGRNGCGKTLIGSALAAGDGRWLRAGKLERRDGWSARSASQVSFESHQQLLDEGGTVYRALGMPPGSTPSKAAKFLIVRFGLHGLLYRPVATLSTGEIRKVLLARALATRPSLLVLDNAFDGLDVPSREVLKDLISMTLKGFRQLLVQGVDASATAHTQVLLITQRAEEIVDEISTFSMVDAASDGVRTVARDGSMPPSRLMAEAMAADGSSADDGADASGSPLRESGFLLSTAQPPLWLPAPDRLRELWFLGRSRLVASTDASTDASESETPAVEVKRLSVVRGAATLLEELEWRVRQGEHWLVAGGNGAGKSTLSRLLASSDVDVQGACGDLSVLGEVSRLSSIASSSGVTTPEADGAASVTAGDAAGGAVAATEAEAEAEELGARGLTPRSGVGWVSTELHLSVACTTTRAADVLRGGARGEALGGAGDEQPEGDFAAHVARWLRLDANMLERPFDELSQGEQKLLLIGAAIALRPALLVLDEPCQGLDLHNRHRVLSLVDHIGRCTDLSLIYITHHYEEVLPCVTHVMHLRQGVAAFAGTRAAYEDSGLLELARA